MLIFAPPSGTVTFWYAMLAPLLVNIRLGL
jgi:hypothetical protein